MLLDNKQLKKLNEIALILEPEIAKDESYEDNIETIIVGGMDRGLDL